MKSSIPLGIMVILLAELSFTLLWACVKLGGGGLPISQIIFFRSIITTIIFGALMLLKGVSFRINNKKILLLRCVAGASGMFCVFYSLTKVSMGNAVTLLHTSPIFVALISPILVKEKTKRSLLLWIIVAFVGVLLVVKPDKDIFHDAALVALLSGLFAGLAYTSIRKLIATEHFLTIAFYYLSFMSLISLPFMVFTYKTPSAEGWLTLLGAGIFGALGQLFLTFAYKCGPANVITPFNNAAIILSFIAGWILWGEKPDIYTATGATLIVAAIAVISITANRKEIAEKLPSIGEG